MNLGESSHIIVFRFIQSSQSRHSILSLRQEAKARMVSSIALQEPRPLQNGGHPTHLLAGGAEASSNLRWTQPPRHPRQQPDEIQGQGRKEQALRRSDPAIGSYDVKTPPNIRSADKALLLQHPHVVGYCPP